MYNFDPVLDCTHATTATSAQHHIGGADTEALCADTTFNQSSKVMNQINHRNIDGYSLELRTCATLVLRFHIF